MKKILKKYFIPHEGNNYHPHILHAKRAILYGGLFVAMKIIVFVFALLLPLEVFVMPDVLANEQKQIIVLVNGARAQKGLPALVENNPLDRSSDAKAMDMATNEYFSHTGLNGRGLSDFLDAAGYKYLSAGENLAMGFSDAKDVVEAWIKSPSHYANLVDPEYQDTGVGLESGYWNGMPTVYVTQHFGWPDNTITAVKSINNDAPKVQDRVAVTPANQNEKAVAGLTILSSTPAPLDSAVSYDKINSKVYWEQSSGKINVSVKALIAGPVESASVSIGETTILLHKENEAYIGSVTINQTVDEFFKVIISPVIKIKSATGEVIDDTIDWNTIKIVSPTPVEKYIQARQSLGFLTNIFSVSKNIYFVFIAFFFLSLLLNIFIEIRKQHPRVIMQTVGLIGLLICLYIV